MHDLEDDDPLRAVLQEVGHFLLQCWFHLVLGDDLEVVPGCFAPSLHLAQILLQLVKVHLAWDNTDGTTADPCCSYLCLPKAAKVTTVDAMLYWTVLK